MLPLILVFRWRIGSIQKEKINKKLVIDSLEVARNKFPGTSNSLDALCKRFNVDLSRRTKHNALVRLRAFKRSLYKFARCERT